MNKIDKIKIGVMAIVATIVTVFTVSVVKAKTLSDITDVEGKGKSVIGNVLYLGYNSIANKMNTYCVQHHKTLRSATKRFVVDKYVEIDGKTATVYGSTSSSGKEVKNKYNAIMAYIFNEKQGYGSVNNYTNGQKALWHYENDWADVLFGSKNDYSWSGNDSVSVSGNSVATKAREYAQSIGDLTSKSDNKKLKMEDKTPNKEKLKKIEASDGYYRIGPFVWEFEGNLKSIAVKADGKKVSNVKFVKYKGSTVKTVDVKDIESGDKFWIEIKDAKDVRTIHLDLDTVAKAKVIKAKVWFLKSAEEYQNLVHVTTSEVPANGSGDASEDYNVKPDSIKVGIQGIQKVDDRDQTISLEGVGFIFKAKVLSYECVNSQYHSRYHEPTEVNGLIIENGWTESWYTYDYDWVEHTMYVDNNNQWSEISESEAKIFKTDDDGMVDTGSISFKQRTIVTDSRYSGYSESDKYATNPEIKAIEKSNSHYGYQDDVGKEYDVNKINTTSATSTPVVIKNHQKYVKLSGYVWLEENQGKTTVRNNLYDQGVEKGVNGITVYLKNAAGQVIAQTTTSELGLYSEINGGEYRFENVNLDELPGYYIEYEYCGITYQSVDPNLNKQTGSKAIDTNSRNILDSKFGNVTSDGDRTVSANGVSVRYENSNEQYKKKIGSHEDTSRETSNGPIEYNSALGGHTNCNVSARTDEAGYNLYEDFEPTMEEIRYINLGLFEKEQADYALTKDLHNVRTEVNGRAHVYEYGTKRYSGNEINEEAYYNLGVKFQNDSGTYKRAIYTSDAYYDTKDSSKKLAIYVTYKIALRNEGAYNGRINSIVDYCDNKMSLISVGTSIDNSTYKTNDDIVSESNRGNIASDSAYNEYTKYVINVNTQLSSGETKYVYLQFKVNDTGVLALINSKDNNQTVLINNVAEINSYTTFKGETMNPLAVLDSDSVPGNAKPGTIDSYEDDTDAARTFELELTNARAMEGTVFVDGTNRESDKVYSGEERKGDGIYDTANEQPVKTKDVKVQLIDLETGNVAKLYNKKNEATDAVTYTDENGNFSFQGFVPGRYEVRYTWGNETYKVQYYKGTIYNQNRTAVTGTDAKSQIGENANSKEFWYRGSEYNCDIISMNYRANDAMDNFETRKAIDAQMTNYDQDKDAGKNTLEDRIANAYKNKDGSFITEMDSSTPAMEISVEYPTIITDGTKDEVRFTIPNIDFGIVQRPLQQLDISKRVSGYKITLANGQVLVNAEINKNGEKYDVTGTYANTMFPQLGPDGLIKTEMDNELIEGATLEVKYTITVSNVGEKDYNSEKYYKYGDATGAKLVTVSPTQILDYVDGRLSQINDNGTKWDIASENYASDYNVSKKDDATYLNTIKAYITKDLSNTYLEPGKTATVYMQTSKLLTSTEDNEFNNKVETTEVKKGKGDNTGTPVRVTVDSDGLKSFNKSNSETITIMPSTGENKNYTLPIVIGIAMIVLLGGGVFLIKKFVIGKNK